MPVNQSPVKTKINNPQVNPFVLSLSETLIQLEGSETVHKRDSAVMNVVLGEMFPGLFGSFTASFFKLCCQQVLFTVKAFQSQRWKQFKVSKDLEMFLIHNFTRLCVTCNLEISLQLFGMCWKVIFKRESNWMI